MEWTSMPDGGYELKLQRGDFDDKQQRWVQQRPESHLFAGQTTAEGECIVLEYPQGNATSLTDWLVAASEEAVLDIVEQLVEVDENIRFSKGELFYQNIQTESAMVFVTQRQELRMLYAPIRLDATEAKDLQVKDMLLILLRRIVENSGKMQSTKGQKLMELIEDPYFSLEMIQEAIGTQPASLTSAVQTPVRKNNDSVHMHQGMTGEHSIKAMVNDRAIRAHPVSTASAVENAISKTLDVNLAPAPANMAGAWKVSGVEAGRSMNAQGIPLAYSVDVATSDGEPAVVAPPQPTPEPSRPMLNYAADVPTQDDECVSQPGRPAISYGADVLTGDGDEVTPPAPPPSTPPASITSPSMPKEKQRQEAQKVSKPKVEQKRQHPMRKPKKEKVQKETEERPLTYEEQKRRCWTARLVLLVVTVVVLLFMLILFSFSNPLVSIAFVLLVIVGVLCMFKQGYAHYLVMPKAPQQEIKQPELVEVFNVRMRLQSTNLASTVEIMIRQREQILGSSETQASKPALKFQGISRRHCRISCVTAAGNDTYYVEDLSSKYGTELNGHRLIPGQRYPLHYGDSLTLAHKYKFVVHSDAY